MGWSEKYKKSIDCGNPKGFSQKAHCQGRKKKLGEEFKSYKTVEEIAKKHRLDVSFIKNQLKIGEKVEHEHTKDHQLAKEIALQHLDEIPDYYTRLKKMESDAKKHHKKFKDVKEHCGCEDTAILELESGLKKLSDTSYDSIDSLMRRIMKKHDMTAKQLHNAFVDKNEKTPDNWIKDVKESIFEGRRDNKRSGDPDYSLRDWFKGGGWVQVAGKYKGKPCAKQPGQKTKPFCRDADDAAAMSKAEKERRTAKKRQEDPNPNRKGKAKMVSASYQPEGQQLDENPLIGLGIRAGLAAGTAIAGKMVYDKAQRVADKIKERNQKMQQQINQINQSYELDGQPIIEKKDACYHKVKSRYKVWPSAYASGALVKCRKVGADSWGTKTEETKMIRYCPKCEKNETRDECKYGAKYWDMFSRPTALTTNQLKYNIATVHPGNFPEGYDPKNKDHEYSMARSELSTIISAAKRLKKKVGKGEGDLEAWVQSKITKAADYIDTAADYVDSGQGKVDEACWVGYKQVGMKKKSDKMVPNCVKEKYSNWREELAEDWQKVNRQDKTDGLSQKAVDAYRRENPGSKLQTAVTEKKPTGKRAKRRSSFCRRMKGMKSKLTSAKTARDPDSRINKALRRWNCN